MFELEKHNKNMIDFCENDIIKSKKIVIDNVSNLDNDYQKFRIRLHYQNNEFDMFDNQILSTDCIDKICYYCIDNGIGFYYSRCLL